MLNYCSNCRRVESNSRQFQYRRCLSLNDLKPCTLITDKFEHRKPLIRSQSLFGTTSDNEQLILKPLPFNYPPKNSIGKMLILFFYHIIPYYFILYFKKNVKMIVIVV